MASTSAVAQIMAKVARNCTQHGLTVNSQTGTTVVVENGSNDFTITYVAASIDAPMGGVDSSASPFLGIGTTNPGKLKMKSAISTASTIADVLDTTTAATVFKVLCGIGNDVTLENANASYSATIRGSVDLLGMGQ